MISTNSEWSSLGGFIRHTFQRHIHFWQRSASRHTGLLTPTVLGTVYLPVEAEHVRLPKGIAHKSCQRATMCIPRLVSGLSPWVIVGLLNWSILFEAGWLVRMVSDVMQPSAAILMNVISQFVRAGLYRCKCLWVKVENQNVVIPGPLDFDP